MKTKKIENRHIEAFKLAWELSRKSRSVGPMILLITRNIFKYKGVAFRGTLADYVEFCRMNDLDVRVRWSEILG